MKIQTLFSPRQGRWLAAVLLGGVLGAGCGRTPSDQTVIDPGRQQLEAGKKAYAKAIPQGKIVSWDDFRQALDHFTEALAYNSRDTEAYYLRGKAFAASGLYQLAVEDFTKAVQFRADYPQAYLARAEAFAEMNHFSPAISDAETAIRQDPQCGRAYTVLGKAFFHSEPPDYREAEKSLAVAQRFDKNFDAEKLLAQAKEKIETPSAAEEQGTLFAAGPKPSGGPKSAKPQIKKLTAEARSLAAEGRLTPAMAKLREAERIDPQAADVYYTRGCILLDHGSAYTAIREFDQALRCRPDDAEALVKRSLADLRVDQNYAAVSDATDALRLKPDLADAYACRGEALLRLERYVPAAEDFAETLHLDPSRKDALVPLISKARRELGETYLRTRQWAKAREVLEKLWKSDPQERGRLRPLLAETYRELGKAASRHRDVALADSFLRAAQQIDRGNPENVELLGRMLYQQGDYAEALSCFRRTVRLDPDRKPSLNRYIQAASEEAAAGAQATMVAKPVVE